MGYDYAVAIATKSEIENGAACGQLSIIVEDETENSELFVQPACSVCKDRVGEHGTFGWCD